MSVMVDVLARALARKERSLIPVRATATMSVDPVPVFAFAPIKLVSEEVIQAIAFGDPDGAPTVITRWNPLSRDTATLEGFAAVLDAYLSATLAAGRLPRVWVPHTAALTLLDMLGHRYRTNSMATPVLQRMGAQCRILADEAKCPGQQVVAVASRLLTEHVRTGQSGVEDHHLGSLLAWLDPDPGKNPIEEAQRQALLPAAAMLTREDDDRVEKLRPVAKVEGSRGDRARLEIERLLERGSLHEWELLVRARAAWQRLGLTQPTGISELVRLSAERVLWGLQTLPNPASTVAPLSRLLETMEYGASVLEDISTEGDPRMRAQARAAGHVVRFTLTEVRQPQPNRHPCLLILQTDQSVTRLRRGAQLRWLDGVAAGRVESVRTSATGRIVVELLLDKGVRRGDHPPSGAESDWSDSVPFNAAFLRQKAFRAAVGSGSYAVTGDPLPAARPRALGPGNLRDLVDRLKSGAGDA